MTETTTALTQGRAPTEFAAALSSAIAESGLSLDAVRRELAAKGHRLSVATLSYWRSGRRRPERAASLAALVDMERVLGVEPGTLTSLAGVPREVPRWALPERPRGPRGAKLPFAALIDSLGLDVDDGLARLSIQDVAEADEHRAALRSSTRVLLRATRSGVARFPMTTRADEGTPPVVRPRFGFSIGRSAASDDGLAVALEAVLDRPLPMGETMLLEYETHPGDRPGPSLSWERWLVRPLPLYLLRLTFPESRIPTSVERTDRRFGDARTRTSPVLVVGRTVTEVFTDVGPGLTGLSWTW